MLRPCRRICDPRRKLAVGRQYITLVAWEQSCVRVFCRTYLCSVRRPDAAEGSRKIQTRTLENSLWEHHRIKNWPMYMLSSVTPILTLWHSVPIVCGKIYQTDLSKLRSGAYSMTAPIVLYIRTYIYTQNVPCHMPLLHLPLFSVFSVFLFVFCFLCASGNLCTNLWHKKHTSAVVVVA